MGRKEFLPQMKGAAQNRWEVIYKAAGSAVV